LPKRQGSSCCTGHHALTVYGSYIIAHCTFDFLLSKLYLVAYAEISQTSLSSYAVTACSIDHCLTPGWSCSRRCGTIQILQSTQKHFASGQVLKGLLTKQSNKLVAPTNAILTKFSECRLQGKYTLYSCNALKRDTRKTSTRVEKARPDPVVEAYGQSAVDTTARTSLHELTAIKL